MSNMRDSNDITANSIEYGVVPHGPSMQFRVTGAQDSPAKFRILRDSRYRFLNLIHELVRRGNVILGHMEVNVFGVSNRSLRPPYFSHERMICIASS